MENPKKRTTKERDRGPQSLEDTSETISSFVIGLSSSFPVEMNLLNTYQNIIFVMINTSLN
jgi:hypothetical protein